MITITDKDTDTSARTGLLHLSRADVNIPAFMPVGTNGTVKAMFHKSLKDIGYNLILGNTYHLYLRPGMEVINNYGGLHNFSSWDGNILTDSGGFQVFSLSSLRKITNEGINFRSHIDGSRHFFTPEKVVDIQSSLGSDIQMQLDVCTEPGISKQEALKALELTSAWAERAKKRRSEKSRDYKGVLFGIVQGNFYKDLRKLSAQQLIDLDLPGYAIGGLSVGEEPEVFNEFLHYTAELLPEDKPRYVMGIGTPDYMLEAMEVGIDLFDCVYPTRVARNGTCFTREGMLNLRNARFKSDQDPIDSECGCFTCSHYSRGYLKHLFSAKEILGPMLVTYHNLYFLYKMMEEARASIKNNTFSNFKKNFLEKFRGKV